MSGEARSDFRSGTLEEQRQLAMDEYDHIRKALICEPRGHREMYGAVICHGTELTEEGKAHAGVLFMTNDGYSTMCGHATIALGRLIIDQAGSGEKRLTILENLKEFIYDPKTRSMTVDLHVPCGLVKVEVPVTFTGEQTWKTDTTRTISYESVPSFASSTNRTYVEFPQPEMRWPELGDRTTIDIEVSYGGAFYIIISAEALGFKASDLTDMNPITLAALSNATRLLKEAFYHRKNHLYTDILTWHPRTTNERMPLYGVIVTANVPRPGPVTGVDPSAQEEIGLCFFANQQVDRSPTGSGVQARVAMAHADRGAHEPLLPAQTYHSPLSWAYGGEGAFVGEAVRSIRFASVGRAYIIKVSGKARYIGCSSFVIEDGDEIGKGFWFDELGQRDQT